MLLDIYMYFMVGLSVIFGLIILKFMVEGVVLAYEIGGLRASIGVVAVYTALGLIPYLFK